MLRYIKRVSRSRVQTNCYVRYEFGDKQLFHVVLTVNLFSSEGNNQPFANELEVPPTTRYAGLPQGNRGAAGAEAGVAVAEIEGVTAEREAAAETEKKNEGTGGTSRAGEFGGRGQSGGPPGGSLTMSCALWASVVEKLVVV